MGYETIEGASHVRMRNLWGGWYPGKDFNDIPGELSSRFTGPIGAEDCDNAIWFQSALRKIPGYSTITTSALNGGASINSIYYSVVIDDVIGNAGDKLYAGMDGATPTDITGGLSISSTELINWTEFQFGATKLAIGTDGVNAPFKYTGSGNAALLGGSPPTGDIITVWQNVAWIISGEKANFSNIADVETWTSTDNYIFDAPVKAVGRLGNQLVFFMEDHIGILTGDNNRLLQKVNRFIDGVGCNARESVVNAKIQGQDVLLFHANDGIYAYNGTQNIVKLSHPIEQKYTSQTSTLKWNDARFSKIWSTVFPVHDWYMMGISDGGDTTNDFMLILDTSRPYEISQGIAVPHWPNDNHQAVNCITFSRKSSLFGDVYFGSTDGKVRKFDLTSFNRDNSAYTAFYKTKIFDNVRSVLVQETNILGDEKGSNSDLEVFVNSNLQTGLGERGLVDFDADADKLDSTFIIGSSVLGAQAFILRNVGVSNFGRFLQFTVQNANKDEEMIVHSVDLILQNLGLEPNVGN